MPVTPTAIVEQPAGTEGTPVAGVSTRFAAGATVRNLTNSRVNVRSSPGYLGKSPADVVGSLAPGETFAILGESAAADNLTWWRIRTTGAVEGWVAEATSSGVQILGPAQ